LRERQLELWQVLDGVDEAALLEERPRGEPNPSVVLKQRLADGTSIIVVWAWIAPLGLAKLVTVCFVG